MLEFWVRQLDKPSSWPDLFRHWRCHPEDQAFDHLQDSLVLARQLATDTAFGKRPAQEQLGTVINLSHGEVLADHDTAIALLLNWLEQQPSLSELAEELRARRDVIQQFGRFPARNRLLQRASTPTEAYFMLGAGPRFC